uniref:Putative cytochrome P450 CYP13A2 n=1 Tax=Aceria tosichella TaxID=561515 RepID=A0A6G1SJ02_9ACAR
MILELLITLTSGLLLAILVLVVSRIVMDRWALIKFKKVTRGLPMVPDVRLAGNHSISLILSERVCHKATKYHEELGKTFGILMGTRYCAVTCDLDLIKRVILDEPNSHLNRIPLNLPLEEFEKSIMLAPAEEWRKLRKAIAPALTNNKFKTPNVMEEIQASINKLIGHIERRLAKTDEPGHDEFIVDDFAQKYSMDLVFRCFYKQYDLIDFDNPHDSWSESVEQSLNDVQHSPFVKLAVVFPMFRSFVDWLVWNFTEQGKGRKMITGFILAQTKLGLMARTRLKELESEARASRGPKLDPNNFLLKDGTRFRRNMTDYIVDQYLDGKISKAQHVNSSSFLMGAADRTAADCIIHTIYLLSIDQAVQDKLRSSIRTEGTESEYLDWVIKESLRLMPPAPIGCSRALDHDITLKEGYVLPASTFLITCAYVIHRLKEYWGEDAEEFKPERWRDTSHHHPLQYIPFGAGLRGCPGKMFAMFEIKMLFVELLNRYKFHGEPRADAYEINSPLLIFVIPNSATKVRIERL